MARSRRLGRSAARWAPIMMVAAVAVGPAAVTSPGPIPFVVHEWGTFVSMEGSDGLVLEGLHHDEADLPVFVHSRPRDQLRLHATQSKLETPVIYFYPAGPGRPASVGVRVDFPEGILTQWYPQATVSSPRLLQGDVIPPLKGGSMEWYGNLTPDTRSSPSDAITSSLVPRAAPDDVWNFTRQTHSAFITTNPYDWAANKPVREEDKFIFYRGLGRFEPPLRVQSEAEGRLTLANAGPEPLNHLFILRVDRGRGVFQYLPSLGAGGSTRLQIALPVDAAPLNEFVGQIGKALGARLVEQGLFADEAQAMVNTWSRSYFRTPGVRVLYLVPRAQIDRTLPLKITASMSDGRLMTGTQIERVFVGRVETLTPEEEGKIDGWLRDLASPDAAIAAAARDGLIALGRFAEPHLRRALQNSTDPAVRARAQTLLLSDALDELIAAEKSFPKQADVTARLAALQRRAGLVEEARKRGEAAVALLPSTVPSDHVARRKWLRSMAFAREAIGDPSPAADAYRDWVQFAAGLKQQQCQLCHSNIPINPLTYADLRDWWGGERFREMAMAAGKTDAFIAAAQENLKYRPSDPAALVTLGYLLPARGDTTAAAQAWQKLGVDVTQP